MKNVTFCSKRTAPAVAVGPAPFAERLVETMVTDLVTD